MKKGDQVKLKEASSTNICVKVVKASNNEMGLVPVNLIEKVQ